MFHLLPTTKEAYPHFFSWWCVHIICIWVLVGCSGQHNLGMGTKFLRQNGLNFSVKELLSKILFPKTESKKECTKNVMVLFHEQLIYKGKLFKTEIDGSFHCFGLRPMRLWWLTIMMMMIMMTCLCRAFVAWLLVSSVIVLVPLFCAVMVTPVLSGTEIRACWPIDVIHAKEWLQAPPGTRDNAQKYLSQVTSRRLSHSIGLDGIPLLYRSQGKSTDEPCMDIPSGTMNS